MDGIRSVKLMLPTQVLEDAWIRFENGIIVDLGQGSPPGGEFFDGEKRYLAPGFIDLHVHGGTGADFLDNTEVAFERICNFHLSGGTTALCPTLATTTYSHIAAVTQTYQAVRTKLSINLLPLHLEGPHLAPAKAGAQDPRLLRPATSQNIDWLVENSASISQMTIAPELHNSIELIARATAAGICMSLGHTEASEEQAAQALQHGARKVTHLFNAMSSASKKGLFRQAGLAEYALTEDGLACELIGDGFHVSPTLIKMAFRCKGPQRVALVSDALAGAGLPMGSKFSLGALPCRVEQGYCALADGSALSGSATRLIDQLRTMVRKVGLPIADAVQMASGSPAALLGIQHLRGSLAPGLAADFVRFDDDFRVHNVWLAGKSIH
ncbi:MAG TPA: N-acetylglucosamine-6-phosphate deacetylase [Bryobacteraceae bacterium]|jgi:N-acetylglucosamine-6-phosphate deacetylase|nr:N-acetylglucosamine-6-phosphate deacetylase [Bryobacteraceae bacterium]